MHVFSSLYTTLSYAANLTVWLASVGQFHSSLAAFDMNCMVNSPHSEY